MDDRHAHRGRAAGGNWPAHGGDEAAGVDREAAHAMTDHTPTTKPLWRSAWWRGLSVALGTSIGIGFIGSMSWLFLRNRLITNPFQLVFVASTLGWFGLIA